MKNFTKKMLHGNFGIPFRWYANLILFLTLTVSSVAGAQTATLGSGTAVSVANSGSGLGPVNSYYHFMRYQVVYTAAEITAAGGAAGLVSQFGWNVSTAPTVVLPNYRVRMAQTTATNAAAHNTDALTEVYNANFTAVAGYNMLNLSSPFIWDGTSNILVDICYGSADYVSPYGQVFVYGTDAGSSRFSASDGSARCDVTTTSVNAFKPQARFVFTDAPSCLQPSVAVASAITSSGATLSWTPTGTAPSNGYEYYYSATNTAPVSGTAPSGTSTGSTVALTQLPALTTHYFWVRSNCGNATSTWAGPVSFTTNQVPATLPYTEGFEGTSSFSIVNGSQVNKWVIGTAIANGGTQSLYVSNDNGATNNYTNTTSVVHAYRDVTMPADIVQARLSFDYRGVGESTYDYVRVWAVPTTYTPAAGTQTNATNSGGGVMIAEYVNLRANFTPLTYIIPATAYAGQTVRLVFEWRNDSGGGASPAGSIDNVSISAVSCIAPSAVAAAIMPGSVTVNWTAPATVPAEGYDYYYSTTNTAPGTDTEISGNVATGTSLNLTNLTPDTVYYIWVRSSCGTENSVWTSVVSFRTDCAAGQPSATYETFANYNGNAASPACWREANGALAANTMLTYTDNAWTNQDYNNTTGENGRSAYVELYATRNAWFISPAIDLGTGSTDYQVEFNTSIIPWSGSATVTDMGEKYVKVVVSTDGGMTWSDTNVIRTYDSANIPAGGISEVISLANYSGVVKIGFYAYSTSTSLDFRYYVDNYRVREIPNCANPTALTLGTVTENSVQLSWTAPAVAPTEYQYAISTTNTAPSASSGSLGADTADTIGELNSSTTYYVWIRSNCGDSTSEWVGPVTFTTLCDSGEILTTTDGTVCGQGSATLQATANENAVLTWYAAQTGGEVLGTGSSFATPLVTETTDFYVSAGNTINNLDVAVGAGATTSATYSNPFYSAWSNNHTQHLVTAAELTAAGVLPGNINSIALDVTNAGTLPMIDLSVKIGTTTATNVAAFVTNASLATVYTNASYMPTVGINTLAFSTPYLWDGTSNIIIEFCHGNASSSATMSRTVRSDATTYVSTVKYHVSSGTAANIVCGTTTGDNLLSYSARPKFVFNGVGLCNSLRQAVTATVTEADAITATALDNSICNGESTTLSVTSSNDNYTYVWTPGNLEGFSQVVTPTETTTYTVTGTDEESGCVTTSEVTVTVNALPNAITVTPATAEVCSDTVQELAVTGGSFSGIATIGSGTTAPGVTSYPNPFSAYYGGAKTQMLFREEELLAQGLVVGAPISAVSFDFFASVAEENEDLRIKIGSTELQELTDDIVSSAALTTVYNASYTPTVGTTGWVPFTLTTPYVWNGGNIVVEVTHNAGNSGNGSGTRTRTTATTFNSVYTLAKDGVTPGGNESFDEETEFSISAESTLRPNVAFNYAVDYAVTWSPVTGLYTDLAATVPYTGGTANVVYAKPVENTVYTVTATNAAGCTVTATSTLTLINSPAPVAAATQTFCGQAVIASLVAEGDTVVWYADATGGMPLAGDVALNDGGVYYATQTVDGCESARTAVTVDITTVEVDAPQDVVSCTTYILPDLTNGDYYTETNGGGTMLEAGTPVTETTTLFVFAESGTTPNCTDETTFTVTISTTDAPEGVSPQTITAASAEEATIEDIIVTATGTVTWYASEADALAGTDALSDGTQVMAGSTYYATQTIGACTSTTVLAVTIDAVMGDKGFDASSFSYYPNPVSNELTLSYSKEITSVAVFNLLGQQVMAQQPNAATVKLNTSMLAEGTYMVRITAGDAVNTIKVVKKGN